MLQAVLAAVVSHTSGSWGRERSGGLWGGQRATDRPILPTTTADWRSGVRYAARRLLPLAAADFPTVATTGGRATLTQP